MRDGPKVLSRRLAVAAAAPLLVLAGTVVPVAAAPSARLLPGQVFAPYFETYAPGDPAAVARASGARYLTLAFLQTPRRGSCTVDWNGDVSTPVSTAVYGASITAMRAAGGDVVPSFGGYAADHGGTDLADSCTSVRRIAAAYEHVVTTYGVTRLDLDVEDRSLTDDAGIDRRNRAVHLVEGWAAATHRTVQFVYTIPTAVGGIGSDSRHVLADAVADGASVAIVDVMTFDYFDGARHQMVGAAETAAAHLVATLGGLHPGLPSSARWRMVGVTEMIGVDDAGPAETFTPGQAPALERWADGHHLAELSFWAVQRDNGRCPGATARDDCSGVGQRTWAFSHALEPFTGSA